MSSNQVAANSRRYEREREIERRVEEGFDAHKVWPRPRTRAAAVFLERRLVSGEPGVSRREIKQQLDEIYAGRCAARVLNGRDVILRAFHKENSND